jgi:hypothetical protein
MKTFNFGINRNTLSILCLSILIAIVSCGENESTANNIDKDSIISIIDTNIKIYMQKNANDPLSYQPIKTTCIDTLMTGDIQLYWLGIDTMVERMSIKMNTESIVEHQGYSMSSDKVIADAIKEYQKDNIKRKEVIQEKMLQIDSINQAVKSVAKVEGYLYLHEYRLKNKFGALVLKRQYIRTNPALEIIYLGDDKFEHPSVKIEY